MGIRAIWIAGALLASLSSAALADGGPGDGDAAKRLFGRDPGEGKGYACFVRKYDADHLARHPQQKVSAMKLLVSAQKVPEDQRLSYSFRMAVKFRHQTAKFASAGACRHIEVSADGRGTVSLACSIECDGGGLSVEMADQAKSVLVKLERLRIWRSDKPDDDESRDLEAGADDHVFRLDRARLADCKSLIDDEDQASTPSN
jgi:hypothetical protein